MNKKIQRTKRQTRIRKNIEQVSDRPRLTVFRSNKYVYAQIIDTTGKTLLGVSEKVLGKKEANSTPIERAKELGMAIAKVAKEKKITEAVFDKGRFAYHGRVKAIAEGAREGGLQI